MVTAVLVAAAALVLRQLWAAPAYDSSVSVPLPLLMVALALGTSCSVVVHIRGDDHITDATESVLALIMFFSPAGPAVLLG